MTLPEGIDEALSNPYISKMLVGAVLLGLFLIGRGVWWLFAG